MNVLMEPINVHTTVIILLEAIIVVVEMAIYCLAMVTPAQVSHFAVNVSFKKYEYRMYTSNIIYQ